MARAYRIIFCGGFRREALALPPEHEVGWKYGRFLNSHYRGVPMYMEGIQWGPFRQEFPIVFGGENIISLWVGQGWHQIMWTMSAELEILARQQVKAGMPPMQLIQVKEKDGALSCLVANANDDAYNILLRAQQQSQSICEACGGLGNLVTINDWEKTLCTYDQLKAQAWRMQ